MTHSSVYEISGLDLTDDRYVVEGLLNEYRATDSDGNRVLDVVQHQPRLRTEFTFSSREGEEVGSVTAQRNGRLSGNYVLTEPSSDDPIVRFDRTLSLLGPVLGDRWSIVDPDSDDIVARIESGPFGGPSRTGILGVIFPHSYTITDVEGQSIGEISGKRALQNRYEITIDRSSNVPRVPIVVSAILIDDLVGE